MHDINFIRQNPEIFDKKIKLRGLEPLSTKIIAADEIRRENSTKLQTYQARRNELAKAIGIAKRNGENTDILLAESKEINAFIADFKEDDTVIRLLENIPNMLADDVPQGVDESENVEIRKVGTPPKFNFEPKQHFAIDEENINFSDGTKISGSRFVVLKSQIARLERALANFMLDSQINEYNYIEISPPLLVKDEAVYGTGQLPKFTQDLFHTDNGYWLIPTAEVPLTNIVADKITNAEDLPLRFCACTPCFRSEAGSAGKDTRGLIRLHQFSKVEMVSIVEAEKSEIEHKRMLEAAENILKKLGLAYRVVKLCSGDTGFTSHKTYDIEVWLPAQNTYREISSISNCGEFQARRMKARYRNKGEKTTKFLHTLNGSGLAIGRTIVAILENYQNADGSVDIPKTLQPYMGGIKRICEANL